MKGFTQREQTMLSRFYPDGTLPFDGDRLTVTHEGSGVAVSCINGEIAVRLGRESYFGRALTLIEEGLAAGGDFSVEETPAYHDLGLMADCSRGAVLNRDGFQRLVMRLSRMGYTVLQLYIEDVYELPDYPYFGWGRGRYTAEDLRWMDDYADSFGIELMPAIQTLAHLRQVVRWPAFRDVHDLDDILLAGEEKTYELIGAMFRQFSSCLRTRRINIGMDEAHLVGLGRYLDKHGYHDRMQIMLDHFSRVYELANQNGLHPMLWSDMFFRLAAGGEYYAEDCKMDPRIAETIPQDVSLLYWDYYSEKKSIYDNMLDRHAEMTKNIIFAGGAWKWLGFCPNNRFSFRVTKLAHESCVEHGVGEVLVTAWGDNGGESSAFSILPALQYWAELCYAGNDEEESLKRRFAFACGGSWDDFLLLDEPHLTPGNLENRCSVTAHRYLFYQDVLQGMFDAHVEPDSYAAHYHGCAERLEEAAKRGGEWAFLFETEAALCRVLEIKCRIGIDLRAAYLAGDRGEAARLTGEILPDLLARIERFAKLFRRQWLAENRSAGLDLFDVRVGGLKERVKAAASRMEAWLSGEMDRVDELELPRLPYQGYEPEPGREDLTMMNWNRVVLPSEIGAI